MLRLLLLPCNISAYLLRLLLLPCNISAGRCD
ncbi:RepA leader peptide Tap (plasmid) [Yersinia pestis]